MSKADVESVFGPEWVQAALKFERERNRVSEKVVLGLRSRLRELDPSLPDIYDGPAWWPLECEWDPQS